ncbi:MAG: serine hydrolase [Chloroflexota bacterium]
MVAIAILLIVATGCQTADQPVASLELSQLVVNTPEGVSIPAPGPVITAVAPATAAPVEPTAVPATATSAPESTPFYAGPLSPACGQLLPVVPTNPEPETTSLTIDAATRAQLEAAAPAVAWPALERLLDAPGTVGLVAYQLGQQDNGVFLNVNTPMPLASVVKLITLVAYSEAVATGELDPLEAVPLEDVDSFYLPNFDLGAHRRAVNELRADGRVSGGDNPTVLLEDIALMMIRHSSNAASDYLHNRLGQTRIEQTAIDLGLTTQTAPCPFIGQFLLMGNHTRGQTADMTALQGYVAGDPAQYGTDVTLLTDAYSNSELFREAEVDWRADTRRPTIETQRYFTENLNAQASAGDYADLMARLSQNGLSSPDSSFQARKILGGLTSLRLTRNCSAMWDIKTAVYPVC